jgi:hypothetical protein
MKENLTKKRNKPWLQEHQLQEKAQQHALQPFVAQAAVAQVLELPVEQGQVHVEEPPNNMLKRGALADWHHMFVVAANVPK